MEVTAALAGTTAFSRKDATSPDPVTFLPQGSEHSSAAAAPSEQQQQQRHEAQGIKGWPRHPLMSPPHHQNPPLTPQQQSPPPNQHQSTLQVSPQQKQSSQQKHYPEEQFASPAATQDDDDRHRQHQHQEEEDDVPIDSVESEQPQQQRRRGPPTEIERQRVREKYRERLKERKLQIYQRALQEVIQREKEGAQIRLFFKIHLPTRFGENLYIIGNDACVGSWSLDRAVPMQWSDGNVWTLPLALPNGVRRLEYKYVIKEGMRITWEPGQNHIFALTSTMAKKEPLSGGGPIAVSDSWGGGGSA